MTDHPDHALPGRHFLARQLAGHPPVQLQAVRPALQAEIALRKMEGLLAAVHVDGQQGILAAGCRLLQGLGHVAQDLAEIQPGKAAAFVEKMPRGDVRIGDPPGRIGQDQGDRRVLHDGIEQQFALRQMLALLAQGLAKRVVHAYQFTQFVATIGGDRETEVAIAITCDRTLQRTQEATQGLDHPVRQPGRQRQQDDQGRQQSAQGAGTTGADHIQRQRIVCPLHDLRQRPFGDAGIDQRAEQAGQPEQHGHATFHRGQPHAVTPSRCARLNGTQGPTGSARSSAVAGCCPCSRPACRRSHCDPAMASPSPWGLNP